MIFVKVDSATVRPAVLVLATATVVAVASASSYGVEPADPDLIPEAREVLDYPSCGDRCTRSKAAGSGGRTRRHRKARLSYGG